MDGVSIGPTPGPTGCLIYFFDFSFPGSQMHGWPSWYMVVRVVEEGEGWELIPAFRVPSPRVTGRWSPHPHAMTGGGRAYSFTHRSIPGQGAGYDHCSVFTVAAPPWAHPWYYIRSSYKVARRVPPLSPPGNTHAINGDGRCLLHR